MKRIVRQKGVRELLPYRARNGMHRLLTSGDGVFVTCSPQVLGCRSESSVMQRGWNHFVFDRTPTRNPGEVKSCTQPFVLTPVANVLFFAAFKNSFKLYQISPSFFWCPHIGFANYLH